MKTKWDYSKLAKSYLKRPDYSDIAITKMLERASVKNGDYVCDVGAGVAHLTIKLAEKKLNITAVEPNNSMRRYGKERTQKYNNVEWIEAIGENTKQPDSKFNLVTFGSSFNVVNQQKALDETARILKDEGWFACMWNHRDLEDPIQKEIEDIIHFYIKDYDYGVRRKDQSEIIKNNNHFNRVYKFESKVFHEQPIDECVKAWNSHATLKRQAGDKFEKIIIKIEELLYNLDTSVITIPYNTRVWMSKVND